MNLFNFEIVKEFYFVKITRLNYLYAFVENLMILYKLVSFEFYC